MDANSATASMASGEGHEVLELTQEEDDLELALSNITVEGNIMSTHSYRRGNPETSPRLTEMNETDFCVSRRRRAVRLFYLTVMLTCFNSISRHYVCRRPAKTQAEAAL